MLNIEITIQDCCDSCVQPLSRFDIEAHDNDKTALQYLRTYAMLKDDRTLQKVLPVKIDVPDNSYLYRTIAFLCQLDPENGAKELRVRNVIDMVLHAEAYHSFDHKLYSLMQYTETWHHSILEQLREKQSVISFVFNSLS